MLKIWLHQKLLLWVVSVATDVDIIVINSEMGIRWMAKCYILERKKK